MNPIVDDALRVESWNVRTGERRPTVVSSGAAVAGLAIETAASLLTRRPKGSMAVTEVWNLRAGVRLATLPHWADEDVAVSADGRLLVCCRPFPRFYPEELTVFAPPDGGCVGRPRGRRPVAASPDGSLFASRGMPERNQFYSYFSDPMAVSRPDGTRVARLSSWRNRPPSAVAFGRDGRRVVVGYDDGKIAFWDVATGNSLWWAWPHGDAVLRAIFAVACSADGKTIFALDRAHRLGAISSAGEVRWRATLPPDGKVSARRCQLLPSPDGTSLAVSVDGRSLRIIDAATGADRTPREGGRDRIVALAVSPDGRLVASGNGAGEVRVDDLAGDDTRWTLEVEGGVSGAEFSHDGRSLWTTGRDGGVRRWSLATGFEEAHRRVGSYDELRVVEAGDGARMLVVCGQRLQLWSDQTPTRVRWSQKIAHESRHWRETHLRAAFSDAESRVMVALSGDPRSDANEWALVALDAVNGREAAGRAVVPGRLLGLWSTDDGPLSATVAGERMVVREAFGERREVAAREASAAVGEVAVSTDGRWMALTDGRSVELWSLTPTARCVRRTRPVGYGDAVARIALSRDGGLVVVGTERGAVTVYARRAGRRP